MPTSEDRSRPRTDDEALAAVLVRARVLQRRRVGIAGSAIVVLLVLATTAIAGGVGQRRSSGQQLVAGPDVDAVTTTSPLAQEWPTTSAPVPPSSSTTVPPSSTSTTSTSASGPNTGWYPSNGGPARAPLRVTLYLEARSVRGGDELRGELVVENTSASDYRYETGGCGGSWGFYRDRKWQGPAYACTMDIRYETLAAGEIRRRPFSTAAEAGGLDDPKPLAPGTYDFFASFLADGYENYAAPIAVEIT